MVFTLACQNIPGYRVSPGKMFVHGDTKFTVVNIIYFIFILFFFFRGDSFLLSLENHLTEEMNYTILFLLFLIKLFCTIELFLFWLNRTESILPPLQHQLKLSLQDYFCLED